MKIDEENSKSKTPNEDLGKAVVKHCALLNFSKLTINHLLFSLPRLNISQDYNQPS